MMKRRYMPLVVIGIVLTAISLLTVKVVPLYDGVGFPDEPYRYAAPDQRLKHKTAEPTSASQTSGVRDGIVETNFIVLTSEQAPQCTVYLPYTAIIAPPQASSVTISCQPLTPSNHPTEGILIGNVYRVSATSDAGPVGSKPSTNSSGSIVLRLPQGELVNPVVGYKPLGGSWQMLTTLLVGADNYQANFIGFGDYALVALYSTGKVKTKSHPLLLPALIAGSTLVLIMIVVFVIRLKNNKNESE